MVVLDLPVLAAEVLIAGRKPHGGVYVVGRIVHHGGEYHRLERRTRLIDVAHSHIPVPHLAVVVYRRVYGQIGTGQYIASMHLHQYGATRQPAVAQQGLAQRGLCYVLVSGVYGRDDVLPVYPALQQHGVHTVLVGALLHLLRRAGFVGKPDALGQAAALEEAVLSAQYAVVVALQPRIRSRIFAIAEADGVLGQVAIDMGSHLVHHTLPVDLTHHPAAPAGQTAYLQPHRIWHVPLHQETPARTLLGALRGYTLAIVAGRVQSTGLAEHHAHGIQVPCEVAVRDGTALHRPSVTVGLHPSVLLKDVAVVEVEV